VSDRHQRVFNRVTGREALQPVSVSAHGPPAGGRQRAGARHTPAGGAALVRRRRPLRVRLWAQNQLRVQGRGRAAHPSRSSSSGLLRSTVCRGRSRAPASTNVMASAMRRLSASSGGAECSTHPWCAVASPGASGAWSCHARGTRSKRVKAHHPRFDQPRWSKPVKIAGCADLERVPPRSEVRHALLRVPVPAPPPFQSTDDPSSRFSLPTTHPAVSVYRRPILHPRSPTQETCAAASCIALPTGRHRARRISERLRPPRAGGRAREREVLVRGARKQQRRVRFSVHGRERDPEGHHRVAAAQQPAAPRVSAWRLAGRLAGRPSGARRAR
jgi:hypothetical protein